MSLGLLASFVAARPPAGGDAGSVGKAEELYQHTQFGPALALLNQHSTDANELSLIGRIYYMQGEYRQATDFLAKALEADPGNSRTADWLGRAWGLRAQNSGLSAASYAVKARDSFEKAVQLDPKNLDALSDVFEFYLQAPGFMGGGLDKAAKVAEQTAGIDAADGDEMRARIAAKRKDYAGAEQLMRRAAEASPKKVGHLLALADFLAGQGRDQESDALFIKAEHDFPGVPNVWYAHASALVHHNRNLSQAKELLEKYLQAPLTADDPSRRDAQKLLKKASGG
jgi:tetratricopeptide (TPR) repeat protein